MFAFIGWAFFITMPYFFVKMVVELVREYKQRRQEVLRKEEEAQRLREEERRKAREFEPMRQFIISTIEGMDEELSKGGWDKLDVFLGLLPKFSLAAERYNCSDPLRIDIFLWNCVDKKYARYCSKS